MEFSHNLQMNKLGILIDEKDPRVCLNPAFAKRYINDLKCAIYMESNAGLKAGYTNADYSAVGVTVCDRQTVLSEAELLLTINHIDFQSGEIANKTVISILNPLFYPERLEAYMLPSVRLFSLDLMPRTSKAQSMDVLSSMASLAGYKSVIKAADLQSNVIPMLTTAAGTVKPLKVLVLGAGVAGLQAIATAKRLGAVVDAFDVRKSAGEEIKSLGANFIEVEGAAENQQAGGYAIEQTQEYLDRQRDMIDKYVRAASIVICTANIPGKKAPLLVQEESVKNMKPGSVIIDLAAEQGGNCALTENDRLIEVNGVRILGESFLARELAQTASNLLSANYFNFLKHYFDTAAENRAEDPIISGCLTIDNGVLVNDRIVTLVNQ